MIAVIRDYIPFYKRNIRLAVPVMITQAGQVFVQMVDNVMIGHLGTAQFAGASFANSIFLIGMVFCTCFTQGLTPFVGQCYGKGEHHKVTEYFKSSFVLDIAVSLVVVALLLAPRRPTAFFATNSVFLSNLIQKAAFCKLSIPNDLSVTSFDLGETFAPLPLQFDRMEQATDSLCARAVDRLMQNHYALVSRVLLGFVISSTLTILPLSFASAGQAAAAAACFAAGFAGAWAMERARDRRPADPT